MNDHIVFDAYQSCIEEVKKAGALLKQGFSDSSKTITSKDGRELVTNYDLASEQLLKNFLNRFDFPVVAEESGGNCSSGPYWVIDPLDGTNNFSFGIPHFCVTIALIDIGPIFGIVYDPLRDELFHAIKGKGAYLNNFPISVSTRCAMKDGILATGFSYTLTETNYNNIDNFGRVTVKAKGTRRMGSAALDLCYVACGRFDGYWETGLKVWDMAAGALIVEEAGGKTSLFDGTAWVPTVDCILSSNGLIHDELGACLSPYDND